MQEKILQGDGREEERIPSVREMGAMVGVNPNTIVRSYQLLESQEIIYNKRGLGYFVKDGAVARIKDNVKNEFIANELPQFKAKAQMLGITKDELVELL
jgi:DNA-binding transcriptional regulator YhcF (GntR family)